MSTPTADPTTPLSRGPLELAIAMDEWRRSRANDERIWSSGTLRVRLTVGRRLVATVGLLTLYNHPDRRQCPAGAGHLVG